MAPFLRRSRLFAALVPIAILGSSASIEAQNGQPLEKVVLQLRWDHQFQFAGYYAADWLGYYADAGLDVEIRPAVTPKRQILRAVDEVVEGRADFGIGATDVLLAYDRGKAVSIAASVFQQSATAIIVRQDQQLESLADLTRLRVRRRPGDLTDLELQALLVAEGIDPAAVADYRAEEVPGMTHFELLRDGRIDAYLGYEAPELWKARTRDFPISLIRPREYGVNFYGDSIFTSQALIERDPELVTRFVNASLEGWQYALENPVEIADRITAELPIVFEINDHRDFNRYLAGVVRDLTLYPVVALGHISPDRWRYIHALLKNAGILRGELDVSGFLFDPVAIAMERDERLNRILTYSIVAVVVVLILTAAWIWALRHAVANATSALKASEGRLQAILDNAAAMIFMKDPEGRYVLFNRFSEIMHHVKREDAIGKYDHEVFPKEVAEAFRRNDRRVLETGKPIEFEEEFPVGDEVRTAFSIKFPVLDEKGEVTGICGIATDITDRMRAEEQLRQVQKIDSLGQLTGGIAHDFNNLLAVILGNLDLARERAADDPALLSEIDKSIHAAIRGAELTNKLLAFSRRQALSPCSINVRHLLSRVTSLMRRTLGETIEIEVVCDAGLWTCEADPGQLESALVNLGINARDAMPDGGKLTIEASNARIDDDYAAAREEVSPGQYVLLAVSDTGAGMPPEVRQKAFDPFFTTKETGKGTGLGLSMVYGFVKQSGGHVSIYSEPGEGTTVKIYLPRTARAARDDSGMEDNGSMPVGQGETVLVVEDDPDVRALAVKLLSNLGYQVWQSACGKEALEVLGSMDRLDLLLTDVVLPGGMSGRQLADEVERKRPEAQVLYMSGYTENAIVHQGRLDEDVLLLQKPFRKEGLARSVRRALSQTA